MLSSNLHTLQVNVTWSLFTYDQSLPSITAVSDNFQCIYLVLAFTTEGKLILWLSIWNLVDSEPLVRRFKQPGKVSLYVLDIIQFWRQRVIHIDHNDLPVCLFFIQVVL